MNQTLQADLVAAHWPALADLAGLPPDQPAARTLLAHRDGSGARVVLELALADGTRLILKRDGRADPDGHFARSITAQRLARLRLQGNLLGLRVPKILAELPLDRVALMEAAPGCQAAVAIEQAEDNPARREILATSGRWLTGFHRSGATTLRPYQTRFALAFLRERRGRLSGRGPVSDETRLLAKLFAAVETSASLYDGKRARHANQHGDFTLRNLIIGPDTVAAIDFRPEHSAPVGYDVVRFLVDYVTLYGDHRKIPDGQLLSGADQGAFFGGYDFAGPDDAAIGFLAGVQLIQDWLRLPADPDRRSLVQTLRLSGLRETALRLFPVLRDD